MKTAKFRCLYCGEELKDFVATANHYCSKKNWNWETKSIRRNIRQKKKLS